jgi:hypothetical protein
MIGAPVGKSSDRALFKSQVGWKWRVSVLDCGSRLPLSDYPEFK